MRDEGGFLLTLDPLTDGQAQEALPDWFHKGFCLKDRDSVSRLYEQMQKGGVPIKRELKKFGESAATFLCSDPGGFTVEVRWDE